ncbi:MAG: bifunctional phosphoserine phosphatase/homoserine phosphotransferase ThrH [Opitutales bacterium]|nr:bifunctional phosphoserine phosphatase/homoserine phosphotransferase ThrH [Opitutales bacterium]MBP3358869.1 bifunctional phosphoserine phosphatase/homoserine phosphotransferase ThrH [Opitutales bacterium]
MTIATLDLEGVLIPEIWIAFAEASGIPELRITTREEPDYDKLMKYRLDILAKNNIKLADISRIIATLEPLDGAKEFMQWLRSKTRVVILSDTFEQFASPLMAKLDYPSLFCHELIIAPDGSVADYKLRLDDQKRKAVEAFKSLNFKVVSTGDSYNDLSMLRSADRAVLYRPTQKFAEENSDLPVATNYAELKSAFAKFLDE